MYKASWWRDQKVARLEIGKIWIWKWSWNFAFCSYQVTHSVLSSSQGACHFPSRLVFYECILGSYHAQLTASFKLSQITSPQPLFTWWHLKTARFYAGVILEISLRVGVIPFKVTSRHIFLTNLWADTHKESRSLFKELYLLYFIQNYA